MAKTIITNSFEETQNIGQKLALQLKKGIILTLHGDLGSGKTTFTQGFAKGLGISKKIISPTFIIMRSYNLNISKSLSHIEGSHQSSNISHFYHVDLYRINNEDDINDLGLIEIMNDPQNIVVIEWPEKIKNKLPRNTIEITFEYIDENKRKITINNQKTNMENAN